MVDDSRLDDGAGAFAAGDDLGALGDCVGHQPVHALGRFDADQRAENDMTTRIAGWQGGGALGEFGDKRVGDLLVDDQPLGRHADLALVGESAEDRRVNRGVEVGVVEHDQRRLAAEFEQHRLEMFGGQLGDDLADPRRTGEVDPLDRWMGDQRRDHFRRVFRRIGDHVDHALGEARVVHRLHDQAMRRRADFRRPQNNRIAAGERRGDRAHAEDHRRVPWRHAEHDADRLAHSHRQHARLVGRDDLAGDLRRQRRRLAQQGGGEKAIEAAPGSRRADLVGHQLGEFGGAALQQIGRFVEQRPALARAGLRPARERARRRLDDLIDVGRAGRRRFAGDLAGHRIVALVGRAVRRADRSAVNDEIYLHVPSSRRRSRVFARL